VARQPGHLSAAAIQFVSAAERLCFSHPCEPTPGEREICAPPPLTPPTVYIQSESPPALGIGGADSAISVLVKKEFAKRCPAARTRRALGQSPPPSRCARRGHCLLKCRRQRGGACSGKGIPPAVRDRGVQPSDLRWFHSLLLQKRYQIPDLGVVCSRKIACEGVSFFPAVASEVAKL